MNVRTTNDVPGVAFTGGVSYRVATASDNLGFSVCKTVIPKGGPHNWHYQHHKEACYCIEGLGKANDLRTGETWLIAPGSIYMLPDHEDMSFEAISDVVLISIFNPPLKGTETHDKNGNYSI